ncbi:EutP/PduV family microcompartment system protein [Maridesulfovibrio hydrothermalis]|uniref:Ethanolamine utilization protein, EutP n=1 Tax=Maridesulfovibrio hydrothermalis AM13 = DSM 14728 TaxID=1121451 RepID=L0RBP8_9BACT|nr:EutP/PduV family microcompartment system protein [Maridesulfovibrio hydrothermalis]CCO23647.1 Ethanolamine utilization protein, EutP [Maridesulfovibrio hydrothermalis AM13 = DSM 14728]
MKKMMLVGETRSGKSSLIKALSDGEYIPRRAMAVEYYGQFINTPGEFLENSRFYHALITSSADCQILALVLDATRKSSLFPPLFVSMFNRKIVGVVTNINASTADVGRAEQFLRSAGAKVVVCVCAESGEGLDSLREMLN